MCFCLYVLVSIHCLLRCIRIRFGSVEESSQETLWECRCRTPIYPRHCRPCNEKRLALGILWKWCGHFAVGFPNKSARQDISFYGIQVFIPWQIPCHNLTVSITSNIKRCCQILSIHFQRFLQNVVNMWNNFHLLPPTETGLSNAFIISTSSARCKISSWRSCTSGMNFAWWPYKIVETDETHTAKPRNPLRIPWVLYHAVDALEIFVEKMMAWEILQPSTGESHDFVPSPALISSDSEVLSFNLSRLKSVKVNYYLIPLRQTILRFTVVCCGPLEVVWKSKYILVSVLY